MKRRITKKVVMIVLAFCLVLGLAGCEDYNTSSTKDKQYTETIKEQIADTIGYPNLVNYFEARQLKSIYELRDDPDLICYCYTQNMYGKYIFEYKCIGYGIPYSASYTSPNTLAGSYYDASVISQAEPNGIYTEGMSTSATWVLSITEEGDIKPVYMEQAITVTQKPKPRRMCVEDMLPDDYDSYFN